MDSENLETFDLDDTADELEPIGDAIREAIRDQYDVPEDAHIHPYTIDANVSQYKFEVGALVEME